MERLSDFTRFSPNSCNSQKQPYAGKINAEQNQINPGSLFGPDVNSPGFEKRQQCYQASSTTFVQRNNNSTNGRS